MAAFAAEPGLLGSSEGGGGVGDDRPVEPDHSAVELLRDPQQLGEIAAVGVGHQAVLAVVSQRYGFGDVTSLESWQDALRATAGAGPLDALVNNAGTVGAYEPITEIALEDWERVVRINQTSVFYGMRTVLPGMIERRRGAIVNVSSMWGIIGASGVAAYQASKGAVTMMTKNAAATYAASGVRINSVHPGFIVTPMTQAQDPAISDGLVAQTPLGRAGQASEVAAAIAFLASDDASYITGAQLLVDGGFTTI